MGTKTITKGIRGKVIKSVMLDSADDSFIVQVNFSDGDSWYCSVMPAAPISPPFRAHGCYLKGRNLQRLNEFGPCRISGDLPPPPE